MRKIKERLYVADFETTSKKQYEIEGCTRVYLYEMKSIDNKEKYLGVSIESFFNDIKKIKDDIVIYFHNGSGFDFYFILWYILHLGFTRVEKESELVENSFCSLITDMKKIYNLKLMLNGFKVEFRCSYLILPCSIKDMGRDFNLEKLNETHNYEEIKNYNSIDELTDEELSYIENDVEILRNAVIYATKNGLNKMTLASSSFALWKASNYLTYSNLYQIDDEEMKYYIGKSYKGGIVQVNPKYANKIITEDFISLDVNSLYPFTMKENSMPYGKPKWFDTLDEFNLSSYKKAIIHVYVSHAKVIDGFIPFIPTKSLSRLGMSYEYNKELNDIHLYLWKEKYELFKLYYEGEWEEIKVLGFRETKNFFDKYLTQLFKDKENAPNPFMRRISKLKMNSIYGKFATKVEQIISIPYLENDLIKFKTEEDIGKYYPKEIASYITSQASNHWIKLVNANPERFIYGDTDSAYLLGTELPTGIEIDDKKIGAWKLEHVYNKGKFLKAKCYIKTIKGEEKINVTVAGMPRECHSLVTYENFKEGFKLEGVKKVAKRVKGGVIIDTTDFTIKVN